MWVLRAEKAIQLKVALKYIRPSIWRRVVLPDNFTLGDLHDVGQVVLHGQHLVVEERTVILVDGVLRVLGRLVHDGGRAEELAELVPVEAALLELADLLEQSLFRS